jgi:hypothetical protein
VAQSPDVPRTEDPRPLLRNAKWPVETTRSCANWRRKEDSRDACQGKSESGDCQDELYSIVRQCLQEIQKYNVPKKELVIEMLFFGDAQRFGTNSRWGLTSRYMRISRKPDEPIGFTKENKRHVSVIG